MNASSGVLVPAIRQGDRHPHQMAADGAYEGEAPSSGLAWLPKRGTWALGGAPFACLRAVVNFDHFAE